MAKKKPALPRYPWGEWFSRKDYFVLKAGKDFHCALHSMSAQVRNAASRKKLLVTVLIDETAKTLTVKMRGRNHARHTAPA